VIDKLGALGISAAEVLVVAQSLPLDIVPARALGLASVWIDRSGAINGIDGPGVPEKRSDKEKFADWHFIDMAEFAEAMAIAKGK
jgi:FMN phosphatase YigB (HAD superfamily)